jgi:hypothetical protein
MNIRHKFYLFFIATILVMATACNQAAPTPATMAGFWEGPDLQVSTIQNQNSEYVVITVYDSDQGHSQNELVSSSYSNGVLTWRYCPPAKSCITAKTVSFNGDTLDVNWTDDKGGSGQMTLQRVASAPKP